MRAADAALQQLYDALLSGTPSLRLAGTEQTRHGSGGGGGGRGGGLDADACTGSALLAACCVLLRAALALECGFLGTRASSTTTPVVTASGDAAAGSGASSAAASTAACDARALCHVADAMRLAGLAREAAHRLPGAVSDMVPDAQPLGAVRAGGGKLAATNAAHACALEEAAAARPVCRAEAAVALGRTAVQMDAAGSAPPARPPRRQYTRTELLRIGAGCRGARMGDIMGAALAALPPGSLRAPE